MDQGNTKVQIQSFVVQKFPAAKKRAINNDVLLLESGIIDSLGMLDVVAFLEETFRIKVEDEELSPEHFATIQSLASFVERKRGQVGVAAE